MSTQNYKVVPFVGQAKGILDDKQFAAVGAQLQDVINEQAKAGWEFVEVANVTIRIAPGCLARLLGTASSYVTFSQIVFRRSVQ